MILPFSAGKTILANEIDFIVGEKLFSGLTFIILERIVKKADLKWVQAKYGPYSMTLISALYHLI